jgi:hypothetical protein
VPYRRRVEKGRRIWKTFRGIDKKRDIKSTQFLFITSSFKVEEKYDKIRMAYLPGGSKWPKLTGKTS